MITQSELKFILDYESKTGLFRWKNPTSFRVKIGEIAGNISPSNGYRDIRIHGKMYRAHRLAWLYVYGNSPDNQIDHINHNRLDNRIENLREATDASNRKNMSMHRHNTSGFNGVSFDKKSKKYHAYIHKNNKKIGLGYYPRKEDAINARIEANKEYEYHENHGIRA